MNERATDHASHDLQLVSAYAAGDAAGPDRERAEALTASCVECAELVDDLRSIAAALPSAAVPRRPRDFRLRVEDVEEAPAFGSLERLRRSLAAFRESLVPVGAGLATIGIAGLLLAGTTGLLGGQTSTILSTVGAAVGSPSYARDAGGAGALAPGVASPAASAATEQRSPAATAVPGGGGVGAPEKVGPVPAPASPASPPPLVLGSIAVIGLGILLFAIGRIIRSRAGPED